MLNKKRTCLLVLAMAFCTIDLYAQTCCSGGVPLANNIGGLPPADRETFQLSVSVDGNFLRTLKDGRETLNDHSRRRTTYSLLVRGAYTFNDRFSAEMLFSGVRQQRVINRETGDNQTQTTGLGDAFILIFYKYYTGKSLSMTIGAGPKAPLGPSDLPDQNGITLNADLQPGSGAWDGIFHHSLSKKIHARPSAVFTHYVTYRLTGKNHDYLGSQLYEFGDELQMIAGVSEQNVIGPLLVGYGLHLRYRHAWQDRNNGEGLPNTGGQWVFLSPSLSWYISPDIMLTVTNELPLFSDIEGTQLTPTLRFNAGIFISLARNKGAFDTIQ